MWNYLKDIWLHDFGDPYQDYDRYFFRFSQEQKDAEGLHCGLCKSNMTLDPFWKLNSSSIPATCSLKHVWGRVILQQLKIPSFRFSHRWGPEMTKQQSFSPGCNIFIQETCSFNDRPCQVQVERVRRNLNGLSDDDKASLVRTGHWLKLLRFVGFPQKTPHPFQVQSFIVLQHTSSIHPKMGGSAKQVQWRPGGSCLV